MKLLLIFSLVGFAVATSGINKIDPKLASKLREDQVVNVFVDFVGGNKKVLGEIESRNYKTRGERLTSLKLALEALALDSQKNVKNLLEESDKAYKSFWISNQMFIKEANRKLVEAIASIPDVSQIQEERIIKLDAPVSTKSSPKLDKKSSSRVEWNVEKIEAPAAWEMLVNGSGVVVGNIDTGVYEIHETLKDSFRKGFYSWRDPYLNTWYPNDPLGHGTHNMGIIVGTNGIGIAPGAKWISCRGCDPFMDFCGQGVLTTCGEWMLCPTDVNGYFPDCTMAPNLVSNSWGNEAGGLTWFEPISEAWVTGGIIPFFSIGNRGPECATVNSPGDLRRVIAVGSTDSSDAISTFSGVGPAKPDFRIKPELCAPGEGIRSALSANETAYGIKSGTSVSLPHVAGVAALVLSVNPDLNFGQVRQILIESVDTDLNTTGVVCAGINDSTFPNYHFGFGRTNARKAVEAARATIQK